MAIGKAGAYATINPPQQNYIGQAMSNVEDLGFKYKEEERLKAAQQEKNRVKDDFDSKISLTGNTSINDLAIPYAMDAKRRFSENVNKINATRDPAERTRLMQANEKIKQSFSVAQQLPTMLNDKQEELAKGIADGKYNQRDADRVAGLLDGLKTGKANAYIDDFGNMRISVYGLDKDGKPNGVVESDKNISELIKSFNPQLSSTYDKDISDITKQYKIDETVTETGGQKLTTQKIGEREDQAAETFANRVLGEPNNLYEISQVTGIPQSDVNALKDYVKTDFKNRLQQVNKQERDSGYAGEKLAKEKFAYEQGQDAIKNKLARDKFEADKNKDKSKEEDNGTKVGTEVSTTLYNQKGYNKSTVPKGSKQITIVTPGHKSKDGSFVAVRKSFVDKDGNVYVNVREKNTQGRRLKTGAPANSTKEDDYTYPERSVNYNLSKDVSNDAITAILTTQNPDTGENFKDVTEFREWTKERIGTPAKKESKTAPKKESGKKYSDVQEKAIQDALAKNAGYSRQEIIQALGL